MDLLILYREEVIGITSNNFELLATSKKKEAIVGKSGFFKM